MRGRHEVRAWIAAVLTVVLALPGLPALAAGGAIRGTVLSASDQAPLSGLTVFAADTATGKIYPSRSSADGGAFEIAELPPSTFELAVGNDRHLYLVSTPVVLAPAQTQVVNLALSETPSEPQAEKPATAPRPRVWSNPLTASLIVVGAAIVVGALVNSATDDEDDASPN